MFIKVSLQFGVVSISKEEFENAKYCGFKEDNFDSSNIIYALKHFRGDPVVAEVTQEVFDIIEEVYGIN